MEECCGFQLGDNVVQKLHYGNFTYTPRVWFTGNRGVEVCWGFRVFRV